VDRAREKQQYLVMAEGKKIHKSLDRKDFLYILK